MSVQVCYYCVKSATDIAKLALEYRKIQEIGKLTSEVEKFTRVAESIKSFCNLIRDDVQTMMHMYFKSAYENLNYALNSSGSNRLDYLRQAKNRFIDATTIEKNENLILSYIGLSTCQVLTGDVENASITLQKVKNVDSEFPENLEVLYPLLPFKFGLNDFMCECAKELTTRNSIMPRLLTREEFMLFVSICTDVCSYGSDRLNVLSRFDNILLLVIKQHLVQRFQTFKSEIITTFNI